MSLYEKLKREAKAVKARQETRQQGGFEKIDWFVPTVGDNRIRFLPHPTKPDAISPWQVVKVHYIPVKKKDGSFTSNNVPLRCLSDFKEDCPLCKAFDKLVKTDKEKARNLRAGERYLYNVLSYDTRKVQPYAAGVTIHEELMGWFEELDCNVFDLEEGYDWKLVKTVKAGASKMTGTKYKLRPSAKAAPMPEKLKALLTSCVDLTTLYAANDKKSMLEFLGEGGGDEDDDTTVTDDDFGPKFDDEDDEPRAKSAEKAKAAATKVKKARDEDEDEVEEDEDEDRPAARRADGKKKKVDEDDEDYSDPDLERELQELGV